MSPPKPSALYMTMAAAVRPIAYTLAMKAATNRTARPDLTELQLLLRGFAYLAGVIFVIKPSNGLNVCLAKSE
jgi:hypothetical protein